MSYRQFVHLGPNPPPEICYLEHLDPPYVADNGQVAAHYLGSTDRPLMERLDEHGGPHGARLLQVQAEAGGSWHLTRTWAGGREKERQLKSNAGTRYCPDCTDHPLAADNPPRPGAKYLTRRQREERQRSREHRATLYELDRIGTDLDGNLLPDQLEATG